MHHQPTDRRDFLRLGAAGGAALTLGSNVLADEDKSPLHLACNEYPWLTFYRREKRDFHKDLKQSIADVAGTGVAGFEPIARSVKYLEDLVPLLKRHQLQMRSLYVNSVLHDKARVNNSIEEVIAIACRAQKLAQTKIIVTNPKSDSLGR